MKDNGYTEQQMDDFWAENIDTNRVIRGLNNYGMTWRDMNMACVMQLPTQKARDLKYLAEQEAKKKAEEEKKLKEEQDRKYYWEHFDEIMLRKIDSGEKLTERELQTLVGDFEVDTEYGHNRRWTRGVTTIVELKGRFFSVDWEEGLTESQENEYYNQPYEVVKHTYEKTITVTEWIAVEG
jgi:hypothetical protein